MEAELPSSTHDGEPFCRFYHIPLTLYGGVEKFLGDGFITDSAGINILRLFTGGMLVGW